MNKLTVLKTWYYTLCNNADIIEESYAKHSAELKIILDSISEEDLAKDPKLQKEVEKLRKLQNIDIKFAEKLICAFK